MKIDISLGLLSARFEGQTAGRISSGRGDPGGKSYGAWQFSLNAGTLQRYISMTRFSPLKVYTPGSNAFDLTWKSLANSKLTGEDFLEEQFIFTKETHYNPAANYWSNVLHRAITPTIGKIIFSMSVQHGGVNKILYNANVLLGKKIDEKSTIQALYNARRAYVRGCRHLSGEEMRAVLNRYKIEESLAFKDAGITQGSFLNCTLKTILEWIKGKKK